MDTGHRKKAYLLLIPARGGSKSIPHKNIMPLKGQPLIYYTINAALEAKKIGVNGEVCVSTDDEKIARVSRELGANVPFMRPADISGDEAKSITFVLHAMDFFEKAGRCFDAVLILEPTSPLRTATDIAAAIDLYEKAGQPSLISVYQEEHLSERSFYRKKGNVGEALSTAHNSGQRRQDSEDLYVRNGAIFLTDVDYLKQTGKIFSDTPALYVMPKGRSLDINTREDAEYAEYLMGRG